MPIRLGVNPIGWSNDDLPELGGDPLLKTCVYGAAHGNGRRERSCAVR
jgi:hypothetical protein